jgi:protein-L-isoaspartate(D-aspartate) O-methyltransferase
LTTARLNTQLDGIGMTSARTRARLIERLRGEGIHDERVLKAMSEVPRHLFIEEALAHRAYEDTALPIGHGQTISQPYIVALMTQTLLAAGTPKKVLEIGTGCGYQTAVLARLCDEIYTVERLAPLADDARRRLRQLGYLNVHFRLDDGALGWARYAPFDAILVAAAASDVPPALLEQLAPGGRLVIPVGGPGSQELKVIRRKTDGVETELLERVTFVPLVPGAPGTAKR